MTWNSNNQEELDQLYQKNKIPLDRNVEKITSDFRETKSSDLSALKKRTIFKLDYLNKNIAYITAFVDGEGSFGCSINPRTDMKLGFQLIPEFNIVQSEVNVSILLAFFYILVELVMSKIIVQSQLLIIRLDLLIVFAI